MTKDNPYFIIYLVDKNAKGEIVSAAKIENTKTDIGAIFDPEIPSIISLQRNLKINFSDFTPEDFGLKDVAKRGRRAKKK